MSSEITLNPLNGLVVPSRRKKVPRPKWMCRHANAVLIDRENCIYRCNDCNPSLGTITVIPCVSTKPRTPKKVSISPSSSLTNLNAKMSELSEQTKPEFFPPEQ